jgi:hypothetical protein
MFLFGGGGINRVEELDRVAGGRSGVHHVVMSEVFTAVKQSAFSVVTQCRFVGR